jgi:hypothetical protein
VLRPPERLCVGAARNFALPHIDTPEVVFCDADDRLLPGSLAFLQERMGARSGLVGCLGRDVSWDAATETKVVLRRSPKPVVSRVSRFRRSFALVNLRFNCFPLRGAALRTAAVREAGGFGDSNLGEDWVLGTQLAFRGRLEFHERPVVLRRVHSGSLWYRPHAPSDYLRRCDLLRARVSDDPAIHGWVKALLPILARVHGWDVRRATKGGTIDPEHPLLERREVAE